MPASCTNRYSVKETRLNWTNTTDRTAVHLDLLCLKILGLKKACRVLFDEVKKTPPRLLTLVSEVGEKIQGT